MYTTLVKMLWEYRLLQVVPRTLKNQANRSSCWHNSWDFCTLGLKCSPCFEGICQHEQWSKPSTSPAQIHCCCSYSSTIYHCKSVITAQNDYWWSTCQTRFQHSVWWENIDELGWLLCQLSKLCISVVYSEPQRGLPKVYLLDLSCKVGSS